MLVTSEDRTAAAGCAQIEGLMEDIPRSSTRGRVLLTGASGRVGLHVLQALVAHGYEVRGVSTQLRWTEHPSVEWVPMNWLTNIDFENALHGCIGVIHLGAELSDVSKMDQVNVRATEALAAAAEQSTSIASFVFASSISVYGTPGIRLIMENARTIPTERDVCSEYWAEPFIRQYARTKVSGEQALSTALRSTNCVVLRPTVIVDDAGIRKILEWSKMRRLFQSYRRSHFVHVDDAAEAFVWALERGFESSGPIFEVFNLSEDDLNDTDFGSIFARAADLTGNSKYKPFIAIPGGFDRLRMRVKFRGYSLRYPLGSCLFSGAKLRAAGYRFKLGMRAAEKRAFQAGSPDENSSSSWIVRS